MNESTSRDLISRYLLGSLSEPEAQRVAEDCFMNEENLTLLENTEEELIERYVRGHLNSGDRKLFEDNFLVTEERRTAVQFEKMLVACQSRDPRRTPAPDRPSLHSMWNVLTIRWKATLAAVLFTAVVGESVIVRDWMAARSLLPESGDLSRTLFPVASRGQERLALNVSASQPTTCLTLDARPALARRNRVELQDGDHTVWRQRNVSPSSYQGIPALVVLIPTSLLKDKETYRVVWAPEDDPSAPEYREYVINHVQ